MNSTTTTFTIAALLGLVVGGSILSYFFFPETIATHWGATGEADGYMGKGVGLALFPLLMSIMVLVYWGIPKIDPLSTNITEFRSSYNLFFAVFFGFLSYIAILMLVWNAGIHFNFTTAIIPAVSALFFMIGHIFPKLKRNWSLGIRTPWTLSSDVVWERTHAFGGTLFKVQAIVLLYGLFVETTIGIFLLLIVPIAVTIFATVFYSYIVYRSLHP